MMALASFERAAFLSDYVFICAAGKRAGVPAPHKPKILGEWRIAHAEARAYVLGEQFDGGAIGNFIFLKQIFHGLDQQALAFHIARV
jgi:hypothetical protein